MLLNLQENMFEWEKGKYTINRNIYQAASDYYNKYTKQTIMNTQRILRLRRETSYM